MAKTTNKARRAEQREMLLDVAIEATLAVLQDSSAPPTAKSSAAATAARLYEFLREADSSDRPLSDLSLDELNARIREFDELLADDDEGEPSAGDDRTSFFG